MTVATHPPDVAPSDRRSRFRVGPLSPTLVVMVATVVVGTACAVAHLVQGPFVLFVVLVASILWFLSPVCALVLWIRRTRLRRDTPQLWLVAVGALLAVVGTVNVALLGVIRIVRDRPALTWNVDSRFSLNHAQTIGRHADLRSALDYLGTGVHYHVGPAWVAGAFQYFTGRGVAAVLFLGVPVMTAVVTLAGGTFIGARLGIQRRVAFLAAGVLLVLPVLSSDWVEVFRTSPKVALRHQEAFALATLAPNAQFGWTIGIACTALLLTNRRRLMVCAAVGISSLAPLKPQYFIGFLIIGAVLAIAQSLSGSRDRWRFPRRPMLYLAGAALGGVPPLVLASEHGPLGSPVIRAFHTGLALTAYRSTAAVILVVATLVFVGWSYARRSVALRGAVLLGAMAVLMLAVLTIVQIPIKPVSLARALAVGLPWNESRNHDSIAQSIFPILQFGAMIALAGLGVLVLRVLPRHGLRVIGLFAVVAALVPLGLITDTLREPTGRFAHEPVEDQALRDVLGSIPVDGSVTVSSDLVDPADNYLRPLRSPILTAYAGHQFLIANLEYYNFDQPDAAERLQEQQRFFGSTGWTAWHTDFVRRYGITHVLIHDRCPPNWSALPPELTVIASSGPWTVARVDTEARGPSTDVSDEWTQLTQRYGLAPCLQG